jgi:hypothetical protein
VSTVIDGARFPRLKAFVEWGVNMQLADVRDLLRLPLPAAGLYTPGSTATGPKAERAA